MNAKLVLSAQVKSEGAGQKEMPTLPGKPTLPLAECAGKQFATPTCSHSKQTFLSLSWKNPDPYATAWLKPAAAGAPRAPNLIPLNPQPGLSQSADPA